MSAKVQHGDCENCGAKDVLTMLTHVECAGATDKLRLCVECGDSTEADYLDAMDEEDCGGDLLRERQDDDRYLEGRES